MTVYFSRMRLNPTRRGTRTLVGSPQAMHAAVLGSHPGSTATGDARVLWRLDRHFTHDLELFVVSPSKPDFTGIVEQAGWPTIEAWDTTEYERFLRRLVTGQRWRFRLTANPVYSATEGRGASSRGKVVPHVTVAHQGNWLLTNSERWGFEIPDVSAETAGNLVRGREVAAFGRKSGVPGTSGSAAPRRRRVEITRADYVGVLQVTDAERLRSALVQGMGRAKAYGCGLMTLAPL